MLRKNDSVLLAWQPIGMFRSFGLTQKNQKVKAAPSGLLRFATGGKWMKLASLKQHPFLFRPPRRSASRPSAEGRSLSSLLGRSCSKAGSSRFDLICSCSETGSFPSRWKLLFRTYRCLSESEPFLLTSDCVCSMAGSFPPHWKLLFRTYRCLSESEPFLLTSVCSCSEAGPFSS